jgi:uncharacterized protein (DUF305 family)
MKDVEFMQGMIHHHAQAVEMVDLLDTRTDNPDLRRLAIRIRHTQADEMRFMERWLAVRGQPVGMQMKKADDKAPMGHDHNAAHDHAKASDHTAHEMLMPGMLTKEQMDALRDAQGPAFDRLFLTGMIQHHKGALVMVKELFDTAGAGQDAQLFNFATDVDSGQRAEIRIMETMLEGKP